MKKSKTSLYVVLAREVYALTGVDCSDRTLNNDDWEAIQASEETDDLANSRKLTDHVKEQREERHEAQVQHGNCSIALPRPLRQDEAFGTLSADDGAQESEQKHGQGRRQSVHDDTLYTSQGGEFGVREQDTGAKSY